MLDEIQSGIGRTGQWFASSARASCPDVLTLAKGLGGGLPIGACVGIGACGTALGKGDHGSTFGGNPVACAAALAVLDTIERDGLLASVTAVGATLAAGIEAIGHPLVDRRARQRPVARHRARRARGAPRWRRRRRRPGSWSTPSSRTRSGWRRR